MGLRNGGKSLLLLTFSNINKVLAKRSFPKNWMPVFENAQKFENVTTDLLEPYLRVRRMLVLLRLVCKEML